jgi:adenylate cyclase
MRISVRINSLNILTIFASLLLIIGAIIICINYYAGNAILLQFAEKLVRGTHNTTEQQINAFLQPLYDRAHLSAETIKNQIVTPSGGRKFTLFLLQILEKQPHLSGAHWSDNHGNFYFVERRENNTFKHEVVNCYSDNYCDSVTSHIDNKGKLLGEPRPHKHDFDPRTRPWYKKATQQRTYSLSDTYVFFPDQGLGLTASYPVYTDVHPEHETQRAKQHENENAPPPITSASFSSSAHNQQAAQKSQTLIGVISIDIKLEALSEFVDSLKVTPHSTVFVFDDQHTNLIAASTLKHYSGKNIPTISDLKLPWAASSVQHHKATKDSFFFYNYQGNKYLAFYKNLTNALNHNWCVVITLPISDFTKALTRILTASVLIALIILTLGVFFILLISRVISKPIVRLTSDAHLIRELELTKLADPYKPSYIREINYLQNSFHNMRQSLASFVRYVPFALVKQLVNSGDVACVAGENREITCLFSDISGFTSISEKMDPRELMQYISEYFEAMTKIIIRHQGTLDKYIGDAIMAFWGAPAENARQAINACQCAVALLTELEGLNRRWQQLQKPTIKIRVGINTGNAIVGNVGSDDRLSYTALGDNINLTSRLENLNKVYKSTIIVSQYTYELVKDHYNFRLLDYVAVRGKQNGVHVYELVTHLHPFIVNKIDLDEYNKRFKQGFETYKVGDWDNAVAIFTQLIKDYPGDELAEIYLQRSRKLQQNGAPIDWQGMWKYE